ncbi:hypothetical protein LTR56_013551 [Elasticomyces elasticus]|nr:hypothetical protein LTR56_013551 [Elasticomyces elasticus]KAK3651015.1 hypothetical protein LTR22_012263 [Elasticomyces elasticus]KAK4931093.1 hypothetical protein LTR49_002509 [Elasticomyces elasticus]KAK5765561.1 hypothetical protein LTS12_004313 [Elasticomyces elasticus]
MDSSAVPRAVDQVFGTPELLEAILLLLVQSLQCEPDGNPYIWHLRQGEQLAVVLLSQRVNKAFLNTITGSPSLQRALFFASSPQSITARSPLSSRLMNPMIEKCTISVTVKGDKRRGIFVWHGLCTPPSEIRVILVDAGRPPAATYQTEGTESWRRMLVSSVSGLAIIGGANAGILRQT